MLRRTLLWASEKSKVKDFITRSRLTSRVVERFVAGERLEDALDVIRALNDRNIGGILDLLGEGVVDPDGARAAADDYLEAIELIGETHVDTTVTVKLTQLGLDFDKGACIDHLRRLTAEALAAGTAVEIDMEQSDYVEDTLGIYRLLHADFPETRIAMQAYLRRTPGDLEAMTDLHPKVRLVKGAYAEPEHLAFQKRREIDAQYSWLIRWLFEHGSDPAIASHDGELLDTAARVANEKGVAKDGFEFQMLYGIRREHQVKLAAAGHRIRVYVPYGAAWYAYLMRRLAERPANLRFFLRAVIGD